MLQIHPNNLGQRVPLEREPTGLRAFLRSCGQTMSRPAQWACSVCSPHKNPSTGPLKRINEAADKCLRKAKSGGFGVENRGPSLNSQINHALQQLGIDPAARSRVAEVGEVADLGNLSPDPEATLAPPLRGRVNAIDWDKRQSELQRELSRKLSVFITLLQMRDLAGIVEDNNLSIMGLVARATEGPNPVSVWQLFTSHYKPSFFQMLFAAWFYWVYYMSSLINNTIDAYLGAFINNLTKDLTTESDQTRQKVFRSLIENTNGFLVEDFNATEKYANGQERGLLSQIRNRSIEQHYGFSLKALCEAFSAYIVNKDPPTVRFFKDFQDIPIIGLAFSLFEWSVNRFIIRRTMVNSILPEVLEQGVIKGLEATQPNKLPFAIGLTRFFTAQLERLQTTLESEEYSPSENTGPFPGTEMLPPTIKLLLQVLALEGQYTPLELQEKIRQYKTKGIVEKAVLKKIEEGIIDAGELLFEQLNELAQSRELFVMLMELALDPFSEEPKTEKELRAEYEEAHLKFERTANTAFKTLIRKAISEGGEETAKHEMRLAKQSLSAQKVVVQQLVEKMTESCDRIARKIASSQQAPTEENNVQSDIVDLLQILQVLASRKELQDDLEELDGTHRNEIWRRLTPLYERAERIASHLLRLQDSQHHYSSHASVVTYLRETKALLTMLHGGLQAQPRSLQNPFIQIQSLRTAQEKIARVLGAGAPIPLRLGQIVQQATTLSTNIASAQSAIDAVHALYPPRADGVEEPKGLLDLLLNFQKGVSIPGFRPRECMEEISRILARFPEDEQSQTEKRELEAIIKDGSNIQAKFRELGMVLQRIYTRHWQIKTQEKTQLDRLLVESQRWVDEKIIEFLYITNQNREKMRREIDEISSEMRSLASECQKISSSLTLPLTRRMMKATTLVAPIIGTYLGGWYPLAGAAAAGAVLTLLQGSNPSDESFARSTVKKVSKVAAAVLGSIYVPGQISQWLPGWTGWIEKGVQLATGAHVGASTVDVWHSFKENTAFDMVWNIFIRAYHLSLDPRVYKAATTRMMQAVIEA